MGTSTSANDAGTIYAYLAIGTDGCCDLGVAEGAGSLTVTAPNRFEMVFTTAAGGSMEQLYDLTEDPGLDHGRRLPWAPWGGCLPDDSPQRGARVSRAGSPRKAVLPLVRGERVAA